MIKLTVRGVSGFLHRKFLSVPPSHITKARDNNFSMAAASPLRKYTVFKVCGRSRFSFSFLVLACDQADQNSKTFATATAYRLASQSHSIQFENFLQLLIVLDSFNGAYHYHNASPYYDTAYGINLEFLFTFYIYMNQARIKDFVLVGTNSKKNRHFSAFSLSVFPFPFPWWGQLYPLFTPKYALDE